MTGGIQINTLGQSTGPFFNLYSDINQFTAPFEINVDKVDLINGYATDKIPNSTTIIRVMSIGECNNYLDIYTGGSGQY